MTDLPGTDGTIWPRNLHTPGGRELLKSGVYQVTDEVAGHIASAVFHLKKVNVPGNAGEYDHPRINGWIRFNMHVAYGEYFFHYIHYGTNGKFSDWYQTDRFYVSAPLTFNPPSSPVWGKTPIFTGYATPYGHIQIVQASSGQALSAQTTVGAGGNWSVALNGSLAPAVYTAKIKHWMTGYSAIYSDTFTFHLRPSPNILLPGINGVVDSRPVVSGTGEPHATAYIHKSGDATTVYGTATVEANRNWSTALNRDLPQGVYKLAAKQYKDNSESGWNETTLPVKVLGAPSITAPAAGEQEQTFTMTGGSGLGNQNVQVQVLTDATGNPWGFDAVRSDGSWSVALSNLPPGPLSLTAQQKLGSVGGVRAAPRVYKIRPPQVPPLTANTTGETVTLSGTGYNGANVLMHVHRSGDATNVYFEPAITAGSWSQVIPSTLLPGNYSFTGQQSVPDGGSGRIRSSGWATAVSVRVPTPAPANVNVTVEGQRATFSGSGLQWEANTVKIEIYNNGVVLANVPQATVLTNLSWSTSATADLPPGNYTQLTARQWVNNVWSAHSATFGMTVPSPIPVFINPPVNSTSGQRPQISGTAWPGSAIVLKIPDRDDVPLTATGGSFVLDASYDWAPGTYNLTAMATFGGQLSPQASRTFTVKTPKPVITTPANAEVDLIPQIQGTGYPGCWVFVYLESNNSEIGAKLVDQSGKWEFPLLEQVPGPLKIYALQKEARESTNVSDQSPTLTVTVRVPKPVITEPAANGRPARTACFRGTAGYPGFVALSLKGANQPFLKDIEVKQDGTWEARVTLDAGGPVTIEARLQQKTFTSEPTERVITVVPAAPVIDTPRDGESLGRLLNISGFGYPGDTVHVQRTGAPYNFDPVTVKPDGTWSASFVHNLVAGWGIKAFARAGTGLDSAASATLAFSLLGAAPQIIEPLPGDWVGSRPLYSGLATPGASIKVAAWFNAEVELAPVAIADEDGRWAVVGNKDLPDGAARIVVRQIVDGVKSDWVWSGRFMVERETAPLDVPTVDAPQVGQTVGRRPMFTGTGEPGAEIFICKEKDTDTVLGRVRVDRNGNWALRSQIELPVADEAYPYSVRQSRDGVISAWILPNRTVVVAQVNKGFDRPVIEQPINDPAQELERMPLFSGTGVPGALLKVYRDKSWDVYATTTVDAHGRWSVRSQVELAVQDASHAIGVQQEMDGQSSAWATAAVHFKVTEKIDPPVFTDPQQDAHVAPRAVIRGTALPGALVSLVEAHNPYVNWGSGITDDLGQWVIVTRDLPLRDFTLTGKAEKNSIFSGWMAPLAVKVIDGG